MTASFTTDKSTVQIDVGFRNGCFVAYKRPLHATAPTTKYHSLNSSKGSAMDYTYSIKEALKWADDHPVVEGMEKWLNSVGKKPSDLGLRRHWWILVIDGAGAFHEIGGGVPRAGQTGEKVLREFLGNKGLTTPKGSLLPIGQILDSLENDVKSRPWDDDGLIELTAQEADPRLGEGCITNNIG